MERIRLHTKLIAISPTYQSRDKKGKDILNIIIPLLTKHFKWVPLTYVFVEK